MLFIKKTLPNIYNYRVKINFDKAFEAYVIKTHEFDDKYCEMFFIQLLNCVREDAYDFVINFENKRKLSVSIDFSENTEAILKSYKCFAMYNVFSFLEKNLTEINREEIEKGFLHIFDLSDIEMAIYEIFLQMSLDSEFDNKFSRFTTKNIFGQEISNPICLALTVNILYNSYQGFVKSYTDYLPVKSRETIMSL